MKITALWVGVTILSLLLSACIQTRMSATLQPTPRGDSPATVMPSPSQTVPSPTSTPKQDVTPFSTPTTLSFPTQLPATAVYTPAPTSSPTPLACWKKPGRLVTGSLTTEHLRLPLDFRLHLPPCYDFQAQRRYPVLYLIHGQSFTDDQWDRLGADETADALAAAGKISPFIIVMPRDRTGDQPPQDGFARAVIEMLLPYIDKNYRTIADRDHRAVGGLSRGAGWSVHLGLVYWQLFGALGAHSPAIFYEDARLMRVYLDNIPPQSYPRIFVDVGEKDQPEIYDAAFWFERVLDEKDVPHDWYLFPGYHEEAYWRSHMEKYIRWYAREW